VTIVVTSVTATFSNSNNQVTVGLRFDKNALIDTLEITGWTVVFL